MVVVEVGGLVEVEAVVDEDGAEVVVSGADVGAIVASVVEVVVVVASAHAGGVVSAVSGWSGSSTTPAQPNAENVFSDVTAPPSAKWFTLLV